MFRLFSERQCLVWQQNERRVLIGDLIALSAAHLLLPSGRPASSRLYLQHLD